jgi:glutamine synthetase
MMGMDSEQQEASIQRTFSTYVDNYNELEKIRKDIQNYHKQFKGRMDQLKKENGEKEKILLKYLEDNKLPGLRSGDFLLLADEKPVKNNKKLREEKLQHIFANHQIDRGSKIYREIIELVQSSRQMDKLERKLKCKRYRQGEHPE